MRERVYRVSRSLRSLDGEENGWKVAGLVADPLGYLPIGPGLVILSLAQEPVSVVIASASNTDPLVAHQGAFGRSTSSFLYGDTPRPV